MTLVVTNLDKFFGDFQAVRDASFRLESGQVLSLLGPSGCGKTTTLRMIAGFERPSRGRIVLRGRDIADLPARKRNVGMVFQSYALFPHMTAAQNVGFGLEMRNVGRAEREKRVRRALDIVRMSSFGDRMPKSLSGGQQQRIALARALVIEPDLLLLDEPLSALDLKLREEMRDEIYRIVRELEITTVFVTHDQGEALVLSDRIAVMNMGRIEQIDTPERLFRQPATSFVADFIGGANVLTGRVSPSDRRVFEADLGLRLALPGDTPADVPAVAIRPEDIRLREAGTGEAATGTVRRSRFLGNVIEYTLVLANGGTITVRAESRAAFAEGAQVGFSFDPDCIVLLER